MSNLKLSSILNMSRDFAGVRRTIAALTAQTVCQHIEVVLIVTREFAATVDHEAMKAFGAYQIVEMGSLPSGAYGWAQGIHRAKSPIIAINEDHSYPAPNWAEALIAAHQRDDYFAVCPAVENGNPDTCTSWANFVLSFIEWFAPDQSRLVNSGAGHNTSYKRDALLADYGTELGRWMNPERMMHLDLIARGKKILLESQTSVSHVNISLPRAYFGMSFAGGRLFGSARVIHWSIVQKLVYALLFPLVPFIRLRRILSYIDTPEKRRKTRLWRTLPLILMGLYCHAFGEAVGYLFGNGNIGEQYGIYELRRLDFVVPTEKEWMLTVS